MANVKYWSIRNLLARGMKINARYFIGFGKRSNGKTYQLKELGLNGNAEFGLKGYIQDGTQFAYVRRWKEDFRGKRGATFFDDMVKKGLIKKWTKGQWDNIYYYSNRWYLARYDEKLDTMIKDVEPCGYAFAISEMEHDKSTSYPGIRYIFFDEFLTRGIMLPDEFVQFMNVVSTIVRDRTDVLIFMMGNTVNFDSPYFYEMGLTHVRDMQQGDIDVYNYGDTDLHVVIEYIKDNVDERGKTGSDVYYAFNNLKLQMITSGSWEIGLYPHKPFDYKLSEIKFKYFIIYGQDTLQCEIICHEKQWITFIHKKTGDIKNPDVDLVFSTGFDTRRNWRRKIMKYNDDLGEAIWKFYADDRVYYQSNTVGEIVRNYLLWCQSDRITAR